MTLPCRPTSHTYKIKRSLLKQTHFKTIFDWIHWACTNISFTLKTVTAVNQLRARAKDIQDIIVVEQKSTKWFFFSHCCLYKRPKQIFFDFWHFYFLIFNFLKRLVTVAKYLNKNKSNRLVHKGTPDLWKYLSFPVV